jgi:hypothetical protein
MIARDSDPTGVDARLEEASLGGETLELILVLRGKVRPAAGSSRWRIRLENGRVLTFRSDAVVAATRVARPARRRSA